MTPIQTKIFRYSLLTIFLIVLILALITHDTHSSNNFLLKFAILNHTTIMVILTLLAIAVGFVWSSLLSAEMTQTKNQTRDVLKTVLQFLGREERLIVEFLVRMNGRTTQSEISKLPGLNRLRAFRSIQKLASRGVILVQEHGKQRIVMLEPNLLAVLKNS